MQLTARIYRKEQLTLSIREKQHFSEMVVMVIRSLGAIMSDLCVILCTCPNKSNARDIACKVVEQELAACVNIVSGVVSVFRWEGKVQQDSECQLVIKTRKEVQEKLRELVFSMHPYDVPEWLILDVESASVDYQDWIRSTVK